MDGDVWMDTVKYHSYRVRTGNPSELVLITILQVLDPSTCDRTVSLNTYGIQVYDTWFFKVENHKKTTEQLPAEPLG